MDEITIFVGDSEGEPEQASEVVHNEGVHCCEHCVQHAERIVTLENRISNLEGELASANSHAIVAESIAEEARDTAEAAGIIAIETAIAQESEPEEGSIDGSNDTGPGESGPEGIPDEQPGFNDASGEKEPVVISVEPEKEPEAKQPGYGFRRGKRR